MADRFPSWSQWQEFFARRSQRPMPRLAPGACPPEPPASLARSLAIFQLGESGGGTVVGQAQRSRLPGLDRAYGAAMALFVEEEHRHADILACCVWALGGSLIQRNWTARLFVAGRRLMGLRLKVLVLLAAEVVGICYYYLLASRLPPSQLKTALAELVMDERAHLRFHCQFLRHQTSSAWRRVLFVLVWRTIMLAAALVVMIDHHRALKDLGISLGTVWRRWMTYSRMAERLVTERRRGSEFRQPSATPDIAASACDPTRASNPMATPER